MPAADLEQEIINDLGGFFEDPLGFVLWAYPWGEAGTSLADEAGPDAWQTELLATLGRTLRQGTDLQTAIRIAVASGHGVGKSALIAWIIHWFVSTREFPQVVVTASTMTQLNTKTWREVAKWHRLMLHAHWFKWTATKFSHVAYPETWYATAIPWSKSNPDAFAGTHEKYVLIVYDEANAVDDVIWETTEGALTTPKAIWLAFGNYTRITGRFHGCFAGPQRDRWIRRQIDSRGAKKANQAQIEEWLEDHGEDSDFFRIRVRGIAPRVGSMQFISQELVDRRYKAEGYEDAPKILSLDVARSGDNKSVIGLRQGRRFEIRAKYLGLKSDQLVDRFCEVIDEVDPDAIVVDGDGLGGPVVDFIRRRNYHMRRGKDILTEFHGSPPALDRRLWYNRRTEIWATMRDALENGLEIPDDLELKADLVGPEYTFQLRDGIDLPLLESKKDMMARGVASPDAADCLAMTYAVRVQVARRPARERARPLDLGRLEGGGAWMGS